MKKVIPGLVCFLLIISCGFESPKSITIKGNPGLYVPLGSPFANLAEDEKLEYLISPARIEEMMDKESDTEKIKIYEVSSETVINTPELGDAYKDVLTYLVQYELADIPLDLEKYMDKAMETLNSTQIIRIPDHLSELPEFDEGDYYYIHGNDVDPSKEEDRNNPFLRIPLDDMVKFVNWVSRNEGDNFGLEIPGIEDNPDLANNLEIKIPALDIDDYIPGNTDPHDNTKLRFIKAADVDDTKFKPRDKLNNSELWIYARIKGPCAGTIEPAIVFEWQKAEINTTEENNFTNTYNIANSLGDFIGNTVSFKKVLGYMYFYGVDSNGNEKIKMTATFSDFPHERYLNVIKELPYKVVKNQKDPEKEIVTQRFTPSSIINDDPLDMTSLFANQNERLDVDINIETWEIVKDESLVETIKCMLCVLIPLDMKVDGEVTNATQEVNRKYVYLKKINEEGGDDLFGRKEDSENNIINDIEYADIIFDDINITITDQKKLAVLIIREESDCRLLEFKTGNYAKLRLDDEFIRYPFNPEFIILLEKDIPGPDGSGSFRIRPGDPKFDFKLYVKAKASLNYTINL